MCADFVLSAAARRPILVGDRDFAVIISGIGLREKYIDGMVRK